MKWPLSLQNSWKSSEANLTLWGSARVVTLPATLNKINLKISSKFSGETDFQLFAKELELYTRQSERSRNSGNPTDLPCFRVV